MFESDFVQNTLTPILAIVGAVFGLIGTGIGVWNLWLNRKSHRLRIKLEARGGGENEVVNEDGEKQVLPRAPS